MALFTGTVFDVVGLLVGLIFFYVSLSVVFYRFLHPLAKYPGPFLASITDLWQVRQFLTLKQPYHLTELHEIYGPVVRYGPDKISITDENAIPILYQKGGKTFPKTEFYDTYGGRIPNVFGMRDEDVGCILYRCCGKSDIYVETFDSTTAHVAQLFQRLRQTDGGIHRYQHQDRQR